MMTRIIGLVGRSWIGAEDRQHLTFASKTSGVPELAQYHQRTPTVLWKCCAGILKFFGPAS